MTLVVDASVVVKWLLGDPEREVETERVTRLMHWVLDGGEPVIQPIHWLPCTMHWHWRHRKRRSSPLTLDISPQPRRSVG